MPTLLLLVACHVDPSDKGDSDPLSDTAVDTAYAPVVGQWTIQTTNVTDPGTCGNLAQLFPQSSIGAYETLTDTGVGTFSLTFYVVRGEEACTFAADGADYTCGGMTVTQAWAHELDVDVVFDAHGTSAGTFPDAATLERRTTVDVTCTGADCAAIAPQINATLPCSMVVTTMLSSP